MGGDQAARGHEAGADAPSSTACRRAAFPAARAAHHVEGRAGELRLARRGAAWTKVEEECREVADALAADDRARLQDELGDVLFSLVNVARLASSTRRRRCKARSRNSGDGSPHGGRSERAGKSVASVSQAELERSWESVKAQERGDEGEIGNASISVERGDITDREVDALVTRPAPRSP